MAISGLWEASSCSDLVCIPLARRSRHSSKKVGFVAVELIHVKAVLVIMSETSISEATSVDEVVMLAYALRDPYLMAQLHTS